MTDSARHVLELAMRLPTDERARVAMKLLDSLGDEGVGEDPAVVERAWAEEIGQRVRRALETGEHGKPATEVLARLKAKYGCA